MKIATVTYHDGINFGAYWQAKCLFDYLESLGHEVYIVDYKPRDLAFNEFRTLFFTKRINLIVKNFIKVIKFRRDQHRNFKLINFDCLKDKNIQFLVFGADEIWNFNNPLIGLDLKFFGELDSDAKKVSYGPSFGTVKVDIPLPEQVVNSLSDFHDITTRDINSKNILEKFLNRDIDIVCDPVFLGDIPTKEVESYKNTIVIYSTGLPKEFVEEVKCYARNNNLVVKAIGYRIEGLTSIVALSPYEFVNILASSALVITSMFHGVMFSLKFNKQFFIYEDIYRKNKLEAAIRKLDLQDRFVNESNLSKNIHDKLDYEILNNKINNWVTFSKDRLRTMFIC
ncbi:polysaccharide pyruvyl transferase family protein [Vibrio ostreicida]|uniref:polysaccharide pyruvyl transferase family protein n=1 Tax=Vibrio ostreicida TaxID=526588 RepID=UPI000970F596|nr:polysaccharide pyruvyl transferase family protein [Vibrio ostreicida]